MRHNDRSNDKDIGVKNPDRQGPPNNVVPFRSTPLPEPAPSTPIPSNGDDPGPDSAA